jgi:SAM-dependent methyltransferase
MKPSFSLIIPVSENTDPGTAKEFIENIKKQSLKPKEIILITSPKTPKKLINGILNKEKSVKIIYKALSKSGARNYGASFALGNYLIHIDINDRPEKDAFQESAKLVVSRNAQAIIMNEDVKPKNFISRIRCLERRFNIRDKSLLSPQIIKSSLFKKIGGFDETLDILDDWSLQYRLKRQGVKFYQTKSRNIINVETRFFNIIKRKYLRGRYIPLLAKTYPEYSKIKYSDHFKVYLNNLNLLLSEPAAGLGLIILKPIEWFVLLLGSLNPITASSIYQLPSVSSFYNREQSSNNYYIYKDFCEKKALETLISNNLKTVLEIGSGTGRITRFLINKGLKVIPTEPSILMISEYRKNKSLPPIVNVSGEKLTFKNKFDLVISLRVIWHIKDRIIRDHIFENAVKYTRKNIIFDFTNGERYKNLLFSILYLPYLVLPKDYFYREKELEALRLEFRLKEEKRLPLDLLTPLWINLLPKNLAKKIFPYLYNLEIKLSKIIPPGRWLIKFSKIKS